MAQFLSSTDRDFEERFERLLTTKREDDVDVNQDVAAIIADVRTNGDEAVIRYTKKWDRLELKSGGFAFTKDEIDAACATVPEADRAALELAAERIRAYHERQLPDDARWTDESGAELGWRWTAVASAGLYVPGGLASYPSSVLMNAIPAKVAGVENLVICAPTPDGQVNPLVLLAARICGVETVYRIGGAQAVAALAYGTETVSKVDKITGPGNAFVASAKRQVFGTVGIDMIAGPSEVLIIADRHNDPDWIALDLMAQAEHDASAQSILVTDDAEFGRKVDEAVKERLKTLQRASIAGTSWADFGAVITVQNWDEAISVSDRLAPEHLQICTENANQLAESVRHAGAVFIGAHTPEAIGDYVGGPNHVLPTSRSARFSSGLSVLDFMKRTTLSRMTPGALAKIGPSAAHLAYSEDLEAHALSILSRLSRINEGGDDG